MILAWVCGFINGVFGVGVGLMCGCGFDGGGFCGAGVGVVEIVGKKEKK